MGATDASGSGPNGSPQWTRIICQGTLGSAQAIVTCEVAPTALGGLKGA